MDGLHALIMRGVQVISNYAMTIQSSNNQLALTHPYLCELTQNGEDVDRYMRSVSSLYINRNDYDMSVVIISHMLEMASQLEMCDVSGPSEVETCYIAYKVSMHNVYILNRMCIELLSDRNTNDSVFMAAAMVRAICMRYTTPFQSNNRQVRFTERFFGDVTYWNFPNVYYILYGVTNPRVLLIPAPDIPSTPQSNRNEINKRVRMVL